MTETMDIAPLIIWAAGITTILNFANIAWSIFSAPTRKLATRISEVEGRMLDTERRSERHANQITALSQTIAAMPGHQALHQLELTLTSMSGDLREMRATMEGNAKVMKRLENVVSRHEDHLLDGGKR